MIEQILFTLGTRLLLQIGPYQLENPVVLAPMAGVTDRPFRELCRHWGAGLAVSEMVASNPALRDSKKTRLRLDHQGESEPRSVQIAGNDPELMAAAAQYNVQQGAQIIDINMGCPAKKVLKKAAGSALLRDEELVAQILKATVNAVDVPVTLKIRTGWDEASRNGVTIARIAEDSGIQALAVHGRTRACRFKGEAEYDTIAQIKQAVNIPIIANGDIDSPQKAKMVMEYTGADGIMIGRAAQGRPWLCGQVATYLATGVTPEAPRFVELEQTILGHLDSLYALYGDFIGARVARKHLGWYLQQHPEHEGFRQQFNRIESPSAQTEAIKQLFIRSRTKEDQAA